MLVVGDPPGDRTALDGSGRDDERVLLGARFVGRAQQ
jgi:hypothetical protein